MPNYFLQTPNTKLSNHNFQNLQKKQLIKIATRVGSETNKKEHLYL